MRHVIRVGPELEFLDGLQPGRLVWIAERSLGDHVEELRGGALTIRWGAGGSAVAAGAAVPVPPKTAMRRTLLSPAPSVRR